MSLMKKATSAILASVFFFGNMAFPSYASESGDVVIEDVIVTKDEYIKAVAEYEQISYSMAAQEIENTRNIARVAPESVVTIHRTVTEPVNGSYTLRCSAYLEVVRDNRTSRFIEIISVQAPYVDLVGTSVNATMSGSTSYTVDKKVAQVFCNGTITYTVPGNTVSIELLPGISLGTTASGDLKYRYNVNKIFRFTV